MKQVVVDENLLRVVVDRLVKAIDPDRIVLFGSRARGDERVDSDVDLLIVKDSDDPPHRRVIPAYRALTGIGVPKDILWRTPGEISDWAGVSNYVATRALREGRVLYEKELDLVRALTNKAKSDLRMAEIGIEHESERETAYLLKSENMKRRLVEAMKRQDGIDLDEACERLRVERLC